MVRRQPAAPGGQCPAEESFGLGRRSPRCGVELSTLLPNPRPAAVGLAHGLQLPGVHRGHDVLVDHRVRVAPGQDGRRVQHRPLGIDGGHRPGGGHVVVGHLAPVEPQPARRPDTDVGRHGRFDDTRGGQHAPQPGGGPVAQDGGRLPHHGGRAPRVRGGLGDAVDAGQQSGVVAAAAPVVDGAAAHSGVEQFGAGADSEWVHGITVQAVGCDAPGCVLGKRTGVWMKSEAVDKSEWAHILWRQRQVSRRSATECGRTPVQRPTQV